MIFYLQGLANLKTFSKQQRQLITLKTDGNKNIYGCGGIYLLLIRKWFWDMVIEEQLYHLMTT